MNDRPKSIIRPSPFVTRHSSFNSRGAPIAIHNSISAIPSPIALVFVLLSMAITSLVLSACLPTGNPLPLPTDTLTPTSSTTPTGTVVWFPPTATPTLFPTPVVTPTLDLRPEFGPIILTDDFSNGESWFFGTSNAGSVALGKNELTIAISEPRTYFYSVREQPALSDFYLEITASPTLCQEVDEYGLLLRWNSPGDFYRFSISCDGQVRLDRLVGGTATSPQPWMTSGVIPPGAPNTLRLAVWAFGKEMRFFVNDIHHFTTRDPMLSNGILGVFARSAGENAVTVSFSDLVVHKISP